MSAKCGEEAEQTASLYRPDLPLKKPSVQRRCLWMSETARSYGRLTPQPHHLPTVYHPAKTTFTRTLAGGPSQRAGLCTVVTRSRIHDSLQPLGGV